MNPVCSLCNRLAITKLDILDVLEEIKIGYAYEVDGQELLSPPGWFITGA